MRSVIVGGLRTVCSAVLVGFAMLTGLTGRFCCAGFRALLSCEHFSVLGAVRRGNRRGPRAIPRNGMIRVALFGPKVSDYPMVELVK